MLFASLVCRNPKTPAAAISYHAADSQPRGSEDAPSRAGLCFHPGFLRGRRQQPLAGCPRSEPRSNLDPASRTLALRHPRHSRACEQLIQRCVFEYRAGAGRNRARRCSTGFRRTRNSQTSRQHANSLEPRTGSRARPVTNLELRAAGNRWDAVGQALCCVACAVPFVPWVVILTADQRRRSHRTEASPGQTTPGKRTKIPRSGGRHWC